ncbi:hypothetical protein [Tenacibaculum piscium]|uniref:Uncharacterized protein n=1 Tax=Tenacibaculum piscium TaxID=1458515 RepID=A0A2H1YEZ5_9FLAO|nr:hypothetical protein [Tenacibaculum piscium]MBE7628831.1 hypothetical protein [Tenacibaculum piscium]MBE7671134.1 hypothetical protein [Tenacibaculum piscium]MBE7685147.1 hypothetical protein [Tenacibaculum piscium]MBE7689850.1 hypothetical protein [Tenacibaculum piscium]MCG8183714.1 hypothetical protein [Tenacibaculum piscium]
MESNTYTDYDAETQIIQSRSFRELDMWISHVNYIADEGDRLAKLASNILKNKSLRDELLSIIKNNSELLITLHHTRNETEKLNECDDVACDLFYLNEHEKARSLYAKHIKEYRKRKEEVFLLLLNE